MIIREPKARLTYLEREVKVRQRIINRSLRPGVDKFHEYYLTDEQVKDLREEIRDIDDEIEELEEAIEKGKEIIK